MLGFESISEEVISGSGYPATYSTKTATATTAPLSTDKNVPTKNLLAIGSHPTGNYALWSEDFTNAAWATYWAGPSSRTGGQTDPFGGTNGTKLVLPVNPGSQPPGVMQHPNITDDPTLPLASGTIGTSSVWLKGDVGGEQVSLSIDDNGNAATLTLTTSWVRYAYTHAITHSSSWGGAVLAIKNPSTSTGITIYAYGAMLDPCSYLNAYLKTTTAAVTASAASLVRQAGKIALASASMVASIVKVITKAFAALGTHPVTNYVFNSVFQGAAVGTPGTLPTNWVLQLVSGLSGNVAGVGTEFGFAYMDLQITGTPTASGAVVLYPQGSGSTDIPAAVGQTWTSAISTRIVGGATTNFSFIRNVINENDASQSFLTNGAVDIAPTSSFARSANTRILSAAATAFIYPSYNFGVNSGQAVNLTLRLYAPQTEPGAAANPFVATTNAAASAGPASLTKIAGKILAAQAATASTLVRKIFKSLPASTAPTASLVRQAIKAFLSTTAPVASLIRQGRKPLLVIAPMAALSVRRTFAVRLASSSVTASVIKRLGRAILISIATSATYTKIRLKAFAAISWVASNLRRSTGKPFLPSAATLGTLKRRTGHRTLASSATSARIVHALIRSFLASAAQTTRLVRSIGKRLQARADRAGILVKAISHHAVTLAPTLALLARRSGKAFLPSTAPLAALRRRAGIPRAASTHPAASLVRRALVPLVATAATAARLVRSILVPLVRPVWAFGVVRKGLFASLRAQTAPQARVIKLLRRLVAASIAAAAILVKRARPRLPAAFATTAASLVRRSGFHRLASAFAIGNLRRATSRSIIILARAAGLVAKRLPRSMPAAATVAASIRRRTAHLTKVSISVLALLPKPLHIKNLLVAVHSSTIFAKVLKLIKHPLLFGLFGPPDLKASNAPPQLQADDDNPNLTGKIQ